MNVYSSKKYFVALGKPFLFTGSPIQFYADALAPGHVTAYGPGLVTGKVDEPAEFTIVTKDARAGEDGCSNVKLKASKTVTKGRRMFYNCIFFIFN